MPGPKKNSALQERLLSAEEARSALDQAISHVGVVFNYLDSDPINRAAAAEWEKIDAELNDIRDRVSRLAR